MILIKEVPLRQTVAMEPAKQAAPDQLDGTVTTPAGTPVPSHAVASDAVAATPRRALDESELEPAAV